VTSSTLELRYIDIHGHRVGYRTGGSGPVIVLIHGMAGSSATWRFVLPALAERFTVVAPDLLGHGASEKPRGDYSLGAFASGVRDLLLALGHDRATVVGQSLGGGVAMQFAYQFPERCDRLVLVSSGGLGDEVNLLLRVLTLPGSEYVLPLACTRWLHDAGTTVSGWLATIGLNTSPRLTEIWDSYGSLADAETRTAFVHTLRSVVDVAGQRVSAADRLYLASEVPTLLIWGDRDHIIPVEQGRATHEAIPGSRLEIFEHTGHFPHCEHPDRFVKVLIEFMDTTAPSATSAAQWRERMVARST
jgi:pimeloyl-ACP methyl ester carboxylesterase